MNYGKVAPLENSCDSGAEGKVFRTNLVNPDEASPELLFGVASAVVDAFLRRSGDGNDGRDFLCK